jgi:hypothetical protein
MGVAGVQAVVAKESNSLTTERIFCRKKAQETQKEWGIFVLFVHLCG